MHTAGDQVVFLPGQRILFTGDLVESECFAIFPWFPPDDVAVDGDRWIAVLQELPGSSAFSVFPLRVCKDTFPVERHQLLPPAAVDLASNTADSYMPSATGSGPIRYSEP